MAEHSPRCAYWRAPPTLRDACDCDCGYYPPLPQPEGGPSRVELAQAICELATAQAQLDSQTPASFWETDARIELARQVLGPEEVEAWKYGRR